MQQSLKVFFFSVLFLCFSTSVIARTYTIDICNTTPYDLTRFNPGSVQMDWLFPPVISAKSKASVTVSFHDGYGVDATKDYGEVSYMIGNTGEMLNLKAKTFYDTVLFGVGYMRYYLSREILNESHIHLLEGNISGPKSELSQSSQVNLVLFPDYPEAPATPTPLPTPTTSDPIEVNNSRLIKKH